MMEVIQFMRKGVEYRNLLFVDFLVFIAQCQTLKLVAEVFCIIEGRCAAVHCKDLYSCLLTEPGVCR